MATLEELTAKIASVVGADSGLGKSLKIDFKGEGFIHLDGGAVTNDNLPADLTVKISRNDLEALGQGRLNPMTAVITGRLALSDMALATTLLPQMQSLFAKLS